MNLRPSHLFPVALVLCAPAAAQSVDFGIAADSPDHVSHVFETQPSRTGALLGLLELPDIGEGRLDGVLLDGDGLPLFGLDADLTVWMPSGNMSARFVYGGMYGRIRALSAEAGMNEALIQGEWTRFGAASPNGEMRAVVYVATPAGPRGLGILRAEMLLDSSPGGGIEPVVEPVADLLGETQADPTVPPLQPSTQVVSSETVGAHASPHFELGLGGVIVDPGPYMDPTVVDAQRLGAHSDAQEAALGLQSPGTPRAVASTDGGSLLAGPNHGSFAGTWRMHLEL